MLSIIFFFLFLNKLSKIKKFVQKHLNMGFVAVPYIRSHQIFTDSFVLVLSDKTIKSLKTNDVNAKNKVVNLTLSQRSGVHI